MAVVAEAVGRVSQLYGVGTPVFVRGLEMAAQWRRPSGSQTHARGVVGVESAVKQTTPMRLHEAPWSTIEPSGALPGSEEVA